MPAKHWPLPWVRRYSLRGRIWVATRRIVLCASRDSAPTSKASRCSDRTIQVTTFPGSISSTTGAKRTPLGFRECNNRQLGFRSTIRLKAGASRSPSILLPLFTQLPGIGILRSSDAGSCINRPPAAAERASKGLHTACQGPHLVVVHEDAAGRIRHGPQMIPVLSYVRYARGIVRFSHKKRAAWDRGAAKGRSA